MNIKVNAVGLCKSTEECVCKMSAVLSIFVEIHSWLTELFLQKYCAISLATQERGTFVRDGTSLPQFARNLHVYEGI
jgi:hypothetical protein